MTDLEPAGGRRHVEQPEEVRQALQEPEIKAGIKALERAQSLDELNLFRDQLDDELRRLFYYAENVAQEKRLKALREYVTWAIIGGWLVAHVSPDADPLPKVGRIKSDRDLPAWFGETPRQRWSRGQ